MKSFLLKMIAIGVSILLLLMLLKKNQKMTRGLRNNNPFNLKKGSDKWQGEIEGDDPLFCVFITRNLGIRAGMINLYNVYYSRHLTVRQILAKYAPGSDNNNEQNYLDFVTRKAGVIAEQIPDKSKWMDIASAILMNESNLVILPDEISTIVKGYKLDYYA